MDEKPQPVGQIRVLTVDPFTTIGKVYDVIEFEDDGDYIIAHIRDDDGDQYFMFDYEYEVL